MEIEIAIVCFFPHRMWSPVVTAICLFIQEDKQDHRTKMQHGQQQRYRDGRFSSAQSTVLQNASLSFSMYDVFLRIMRLLVLLMLWMRECLFVAFARYLKTRYVQKNGEKTLLLLRRPSTRWGRKWEEGDGVGWLHYGEQKRKVFFATHVEASLEFCFI